MTGPRIKPSIFTQQMSGLKRTMHSGDFYFGSKKLLIHTLLGSCISITLWHPEKKLSGMCHFVLPKKSGSETTSTLNPRYGEDCIKLFQQHAKQRSTQLAEYDIKIFGGGNMGRGRKYRHIGQDDRMPVGDSNTAAAMHLLSTAGATIKLAHVGEFGYRSIIFNTQTGDVWVKFTSLLGEDHNFNALKGRF